jgi:hypothetical protein
MNLKKRIKEVSNGFISKASSLHEGIWVKTRLQLPINIYIRLPVVTDLNIFQNQ